MERYYYVNILESRLEEKRKFIQVLAGPRQVGKTTIIQDLLKKVSIPYISESADGVALAGKAWLYGIWEAARQLFSKYNNEVLLVIDEIQKISNWSEHVKKLWDEDTKEKRDIKVILSGSSRVLLGKGLTESLQGRFELIPVMHWSYKEMKEVFGITLEQYIYFGSYPGPVELVKDEKRWSSYIRDSIIEPSISKDVLMLTEVKKPALLRQLFDLSCLYSSQILPFSKMLGQLDDAGNTTTLAGYLTLLDQSGLICGLQKYSGSEINSRASSPKLQVYNNALLATMEGLSFDKVTSSPDLWGRFVESSIGSYLVNCAISENFKVYYWRDRNLEVDYVIEKGNNLIGLEIKSGSRVVNKGMEEFKKRYPKSKIYSVSIKESNNSSVIPLNEFLDINPTELF